MKRFLFLVSSFHIIFLAFAIRASAINNFHNHSPADSSIKKEVNNITRFDSTLNQLEIYDPAAKMNYLGLGFPGSAGRSMLFEGLKRIAISPIFHSFQGFLYTTDFSTKFDLKKPLTQIKYVIFPSLKTEQYLDLFHSRNVNKNINLGLAIRKIKSNGYFLNQGANISNVVAYIDGHSNNKRFHIYTSFVFNGIVSIENGGLVNDTVVYGSRGITLQSLPVRLDDAKNRVIYAGGKIGQSFDFGKFTIQKLDSVTERKVFKPSSRISLNTSYSNHSTTYLDNNSWSSGYYKEIYYDSTDTFDKLVFESFHSELSYSTLEKSNRGRRRFMIAYFGMDNELSNLTRRDLKRTFTNSTGFFKLGTPQRGTFRADISGRYFMEGYNKDNYEFNALLGRKFLDSTRYEFTTDFVFSKQKSQPEFVYLNYYSNHFRWNNLFNRIETSQLAFQFASESLFDLTFKYTQLNNFVFLDSASKPSQMKNNLNLISGRLAKLFNLGTFYLKVNLAYQHVVSGKDVLGLPEIYTKNSIYWQDFLFKKALDMQIGFDVFYASKFFGYAYQPSLNTFYFQNKKEVGGYTNLDLFMNMKIGRVRLFFKVDHLNYGLSSGTYQLVPSYLMPGRTYRFGLSWLFFN